MATRQPQAQEDFPTGPHSVDLRDYWSIVRRRWRLIAIMSVIGVLAGAAYSAARGPSYTATAQVVVQPVTQGPLNQTTQATSQVNMSTEQAIAQSGPVIQQAAATLKVPASTLESAAAKRLSVTVPASTLTTSNVLQIAWQASSKLAAQQGANAFASAYLSYRHHQLAGQIAVLQATLQQQISSLRTQIAKLSGQLAGNVSATTRQVLTIRLNELTSQASTAETQLAALPTYNDSGGSVIPAVLNSKSSSFGRSALVGIGLILGLLLGLAIAFARDLSDDRVRDAAQLEQRLGAPVLAIVPAAEAAAARRPGQASPSSTDIAIAILTEPDSRAADTARVLRATVEAVSLRRNLRVLMVVAADTSMSAGLVVAELGVALAESGRRVLLVASDTQGSALPQIFGVAGNPGLNELLTRGDDPGAYIKSPRQASGALLPVGVEERLAVLPSGREPAYALSSLDSDRMARTLRRQREEHDFVLLDAPSGAGADILALASHVDGVIVLARQAHTKGRNLTALCHRLGQVGAPVVGGVLISRMRGGRHRHAPVQPESAASPLAADGPAPVAPPPGSPSNSVSPPTIPLPLPSKGMTSSLAQGSGPEQPQ
jgi:polysaccharide biosynthesis transport protein